MTEATPKTEKKKAQSTRVYTLTDLAGKKRNVEATSAAQAVLHVFKPHVSKPLTGAEVAALGRAGVEIEVVS